MWIMAGIEAVRSALRRMLPITHACSHVKCAKVKDFSSCARSERWREGWGSVSSILAQEEEPGEEGCEFDVGCDEEDMRIL